MDIKKNKRNGKHAKNKDDEIFVHAIWPKAD